MSLTAYVHVLQTPRAASFVAAGLVGRLPLAMLGLGTVLLVSDQTGSFGLSGAVSATLALASALVGPRVGRLADRRGQRQVLIPLLALHVAGVAALIVAARTGAPHPLLFVAAVAAGASFPSLGSLVRARWTALLGGTPMLQTAYALESILDDLVFTLGPVLIITIGTISSPAAGLVATVLLTVGGGLALAVQRSTEPPASGARRGGVKAIRAPGLPALILVFVAVGIVLGCVDVAVVASSGEHHSKASAGVLLAVFSVASGAGGLAYGARAWSMPVARRLQWSTGLMAVCVVPLVVVDSMAALVPALLVAGVALTPTIISGFSLVETLVPREALTEGFTWLSTSLAGGVAVGLAITGSVVDRAGGHAAFVVALVAAAVAATIATLGRRRFA